MYQLELVFRFEVLKKAAIRRKFPATAVIVINERATVKTVEGTAEKHTLIGRFEDLSWSCSFSVVRIFSFYALVAADMPLAKDCQSSAFWKRRCVFPAVN